MSGTTPLVHGLYELVTFSNGRSFPRKFLRDALPTVQLAVFFVKVYDLEPKDLSVLLHEVVDSAVSKAFCAESDIHSTDLQDYLVAEYWDGSEWTFVTDDVEVGTAEGKAPVHPELLPEVWKALEIEIAQSIKDVATKIGDTVAHMPGRTGEMVFQTLAKVNAKRPTIGDYRAGIHHQQVKNVLLVFDVSGSMSEQSVRTMCDDVVGLGYETNAALAIVSNTCTYWDPGAYNTDTVLEAAEYAGTHYEKLAPLFDGRSWDAVITVADYDSSPSAKRVLEMMTGHIGQLFDISIVNRSTYLAECLAPMADEVRPLMVASRDLSC